MRPLFFILLCLLLVQAQAQDERPRHFVSLGVAPSYLHLDKVPDNLITRGPVLASATSVHLLRRIRNREHAWGIGGGVMVWGDRILYPVHFTLNLDIATLFSKDKEPDPDRNDRWKLTGGVGAIFGEIPTTHGSLSKGAFYHGSYRYRLTHGRTQFHVGLMTNYFTMRGPYQQFVDGEWVEKDAKFFFIGPALWVDL